MSQNDLRIHFGLGKAEKVEVLEIRWPSGQIDTLKDVKANQLIFVKEGAGITRTMQFEKRLKSPGQGGSGQVKLERRRQSTLSGSQQEKRQGRPPAVFANLFLRVQTISC